MKKILFVCLLTFVGLSCDKDDPEAEGTPMERLTGTDSKKWKLNFAEARDKEGLSVPLMSLYECWADNILTLHSNGSYTLEDTGKKCVDSENISSTWTLTDNADQIKLANFTIAGQAFENLTLEVKEIKKSSFSGIARNVTYGTLVADEVELRFSVVVE